MINEKRRTEGVQKFKKKHHKPLDQRLKRTRAMRRKLTLFERTRKTPREAKRLVSNPKRKFALEA